ncbi:MAG: HAD-IIIA family hydrolase [Promethearchaeota archaeon]|nr:MAG: HAD-IIIA family hydrolase [Candidatus Lokiarchaeota archaeon]
MKTNSIVLVIGYPASGKSTYAQKFKREGYYRLNRDELGGSLDDLVIELDKINRTEGVYNFVLDNTYATRKSRKSVVDWAKEHNFEIECHWIDLDIGDSLYNQCQRIIRKYGKLLMPNELKSERDSSVYPPVAIYRFRKIFEAPTITEGFDKVVKVPFHRNLDKKIYKKQAYIFDYDGTLRSTISGEKYPLSPDDIQIFPERARRLRELYERGYRILGVSNMSLVSKNKISLDIAIECYERTNDLLKVPIEYAFCPHPAFPQICYCRKPMPGLGVAFIEKHKLDPMKCVMVGDMKTDKTFADRCGFHFEYANDFFKQ